MRKPAFRKRRTCPFSADNAPKIDYKNVKLLQKFVSEAGKVSPVRITSVAPKQQRKLIKAIKRARYLGLMHYENK